MRVYRLNQDPDRWQCLHPKGASRIFAFDQPDHLEDGASRAAEWKPPRVEWSDPRLEASDFSMPGSGGLIAHPRAFEVLGPLLAEAGELLPVPHKGETHHFLHVRRYLPKAFDLKASKFSGSEITKHVFDPTALAGVGLFKVGTLWRTKTSCECVLELYLADGHRDAAHGFRALYDTHGLKGLEFVKVWER